MAMESTSPAAVQVRVQLSTRNGDIELPPGTGSILVSTEFRRLQLSTLVNKLIETDRPIPLEFLINGQFLRTSLDEFLTQNGISAETTVNIEYVKALVPPLPVATYEHYDWVSSVDVWSASSKAALWSKASLDGASQRILSASFDGLLRMWNMSSEVVATGEGHTAPVKVAKFVSPSQIASAGVDRTVRLWNWTERTLTPTLELFGHKSSVEGLAVHTPSSRLLTASSDHSIGVWSTKKSQCPAAPEGIIPASNKRRKISGPTAPQRGPLSFLKGHQSQVSDVCFDARDATVGYSASWDHSVKTWDLTTGACVDTRTTAQSLFSICHLSEASLLATGTSARHITLIDPRASAATVSAMTLRGHSNAVVSLAADPDSSYRLVSGSHDGTCRVWDIRSVHTEAGTDRVGNSVYVMERDSNKSGAKAVGGEGIKVYSVFWDHEVGIVSGGEDKKVQINQSNSR